jgi:hypothetical protein
MEFNCMCGRKLSVPDAAAGRKARCPACNAVLTVPGTQLPVEASPTSEPDRLMDRLGADIAESRKRAPQLTQIALTLAAWSLASLLLTLIVTIASRSIVLWILVWLPLSAAGGLMAYGTILADHRLPKLAAVASPIIIGANWTMLWDWATVVSFGPSALCMVLISLVNVVGYGFVYWYFRRPGMALLFPEKPRIAGVSEEEPQPAQGAEKR